MTPWPLTLTQRGPRNFARGYAGQPAGGMNLPPDARWTTLSGHTVKLCREAAMQRLPPVAAVGPTLGQRQ